MYYPNVPKRGRIYEGGDWSESFDDDDNPVWRGILPQLPPGIRNLDVSNGESEVVWNARRCPVVDLKLVAKAYEKDNQGKDK